MCFLVLSTSSSDSHKRELPFSKSDESHHLLQTEYKGVISIVTSYTPLHPCVHAMLNDLASVLPEVVRMDFIAQECVTKAESVLRCLPAGVQRLPIDMAVAVAAYTYDLGISSATADGRYLIFHREQCCNSCRHSDNLFVALNNMLRQRDNTKVRSCNHRVFVFAFN